MSIRDWIPAWPVVRQVRGNDRLGLAEAARSSRQTNLRPRTAGAGKVAKSICPYCAVGCGQRVYVKDGDITQIEGDPDSSISRGRLCPKGAASRNLVQSPTREYKVKYRRSHGTQWEELDLETAMDMISDRLIKTREETWQEVDQEGRRLQRTLGFAHLGGATLDNEENYLIKKVFTAMGASGQREQGAIAGEQSHYAHGGALEHGEPPETVATLQHPRCVFQLLKKHYRRYTPEVVEQICGVSKDSTLAI